LPRPRFGSRPRARPFLDLYVDKKKQGNKWQGKVWKGKVKQGNARQYMARQGKVRHGKGRLDMEIHGNN
jgi:hypothetical protein